jgi:DNA repair protein RadC
MRLAAASGVSDEDTGIERRSVEDLLLMILRRPSGDLLERAGGLERLSRADVLEIAAHLDRRTDTDERRPPARSALVAARALTAAFELGRRAEIARRQPRLRLGSPADVAAWAGPRIATLEHEELWMLALDGRGHLRAARCVAKGGLHGAAVRAADPLRAALRVYASAFVLVHNHPSGDPTPSKEDVHLTAQVAAAAAVVGVALLDHVVVTRNAFACVPLPCAPREEEAQSAVASSTAGGALRLG